MSGLDNYRREARFLDATDIWAHHPRVPTASYYPYTSSRRNSWTYYAPFASPLSDSDSGSGICNDPECAQCQRLVTADASSSRPRPLLPSLMPRSPSPTFAPLPPKRETCDCEECHKSRSDYYYGSPPPSSLQTITIPDDKWRRDQDHYTYNASRSMPPPKLRKLPYGQRGPRKGSFYVDPGSSFVFITSREQIVDIEDTAPTTMIEEVPQHENKVLLRATVPDPEVKFPLNNSVVSTILKNDSFNLTLARPSPRRGLKRKWSESTTDTTSEGSNAPSTSGSTSGTDAGSSAPASTSSSAEGDAGSAPPKLKRQRTMKMYEKSDRVLRSSKSTVSITEST